jgi:hypothetical protein
VRRQQPNQACCQRGLKTTGRRRVYPSSCHLIQPCHLIWNIIRLSLTCLPDTDPFPDMESRSPRIRIIIIRDLMIHLFPAIWVRFHSDLVSKANAACASFSFCACHCKLCTLSLCILLQVWLAY